MMDITPPLPSIEDRNDATGLRRLLNSRLWIPFAAAFLVGMLVHSPVYGNGLVNPDGLWHGEYSVAGTWEASLGRWGLYFVDILQGGINSSVLAAFWTILFVSLAGALVASLFQIRCIVKAIAMPMLLTCSPMVAMLLTYPYCAGAYALSFLLGVLAVYAIHAFPGKVKGTLISTLCVVLLVGLYQSSLGVTLAVAAGYVLMRLLRRPDELRAVGKEALHLCIAVIAGMVLYYALMHLALRVWGVSLSEYKGAGSASILSILRSIPDGIRHAYLYFQAFFLKDYIARNPYYTGVIYCLLAGVALISLAVRLATAESKRPLPSVLCLLLVAVLPVCCNIINLLVPQTEFYLLMTGGMMMALPLWIALTDVGGGSEGRRSVLRLRRGLDIGGTALAFALVWVFVLSSQTDASVLQASKNQTIALANRVWQQVEASEDYVPDETTLLIAGHPQEGNFPNPSQLTDKANVYANWGIVWNAYDGNIHTWAQVFRQYLGVTYAGVSAEQFAEISASEAFQQMPLYPRAGSVQRIHDVLVVKISDTAAWAD